MPDPLASTQSVIKILEAGRPVVGVSNTRVNALPEGVSKHDLPGPWETASVAEFLRERSFLGNLFETDDLVGIPTNVIDYTIEARWDYNGQYIADFHITGNGDVQIFSSLDVDVEVYDSYYNDDDVVEMKYDIILTMNNIASGHRRVVIHAMVRGDGSGMSIQ